MLTWTERPTKHKLVLVGTGIVLVLGILTATATVASMFHSNDITTSEQCQRIVSNTKQMVEEEAAKIVTDRAAIGYDADCDSLDPGGVSGPTTDSPTEIQARMRALGDVQVHTNDECADQLGKNDDTCRYLIYRPRGQDRTYIVRPVADPDEEFSIGLTWDQRDF